ncbi:translocation/assembly module TamB domain-containing protein [Ideonella sp. B7]|uniref:translocation/assembly module TamB domain-containing protein n=1 Tax=Ideonella benzenivorans TaxID=2831643 RepID=UPI001CECEB31|nr:translocation/assembly module TamB domain-containing protein [Ideonella benzenivorans]MCA6217927.1 translocation/assembly module TamB domain-containing protein [Ideonella benzenivorans]
MSELPPTDPTPTPDVPPPAPARRRAWLAAAGLALGLGAATAAGLGAWVWHSQDGLSRALALVPGLTVEGLQGTLADGRLQVGRLHLSLASGQLEVTQLRIETLHAQWRPRAGAWLRLEAGRIAADRVQWQSATNAPASPPPSDLRLPLDLRVDRLAIGQIDIAPLPPLTHLQAQLELGAGQGQQHRLTLQNLDTDRFQVSGQARIGTAGPMAVLGQLALHSLTTTDTSASLPWQATLALQGPLSALDVHARLAGQAAHPQDTAPQAELRTHLSPFAAWPLGELSLQTTALDLAGLSSSAPHTRLDVQARVHSAGLHQPAQAEVQATNQAPGRWDEGRLPLRTLSLTLQGTPQPLTELSLQRLDLEWANAKQSAGRWSGKGRYRVDQGRADLTLQVTHWQPAALDPRLPAMTLGGPVTLQLSELPVPGQPASGAAPTLALKTALQGPLETSAGGHTTAAFQFDGQLARQRVTVQTLQLNAGAAQASLSGDALRLANADWQWQIKGQLKDLDLRTWWPGEPDSEWRRAPQRLQAELSSTGSLPEDVAPQPLALWKALKGQIQLQLHPSVVAGVPVQGRLEVDKRGEQQRASAELQLDDGHLQARWAGNALAPERAQGDATLTLPRLQTLAPWLRLFPALAGWAPQAGRLDLNARLGGETGNGRWQTRLDLQDLQAGTVQMSQAQLNAQGGLHETDPLQGSLKIRQLREGGRSLTQLDGQLSGSLQRHHASLRADTGLHPPAWLERLAGNRGGAPTQLTADLDGQWQADTGGPRWQGTLQQLQLRAADGSGQPWLALHTVQGHLQWRPDGSLQQASLSPGVLALPGGGALRWTEASWQGGDPARPPRALLRAQLDPLAVAPLLAKTQPGMMWAGDLRMGGSIALQWDRQLDLDVVLERQSGDLSIDEDGLISTPGRLALALSDLRVGLSAHQGQWQFTQGLAGLHLGVLGGALTARTAPERWWPDVQAPLQGSFSLKVAELGAWASWVPAGWRLGGALEANGLVTGRWGAPEASGQVNGQGLSLRNALQGVDLSQGQLKLHLDGAHAHLDSLRFKGGDGQIEATGDAELGEHPQARLKIEAHQFRALGRLDRRLVASGNATLLLDRDQLALDGQVTLDEGLIDVSRGDGPSLSDDVVIAGTPAASTAPQDPNGNGAKRVTRLNLALDLGKKLRLRGHGIDTTLQGALKLGNPQRKLALQGTVRTVQGTYKAYGQNLRIARGDLLFTGPLDDPRLDIYAVRPNLDTNVGVLITGTALNPRVRLASDTDMSDTERLSWLVMGRAPDNLGEADTAMLQRAALALLAGDGESPTDKVLGALGLTDFGMRRDTSTTGAGSTVQSTIFSVGKQLSNRWYVGYEHSINATAGSWQLIYRVAQRFTLRAQSGEDNAVDAIWSWRWN